VTTPQLSGSPHSTSSTFLQVALSKQLNEI